LITSDQSIDRVLNAGLPVLLVFLSRSDGDGFRPALEQIAKTYAGQVLVVQTTPADSPQAARRYQVSGSPALVALKNGQVQSKSERIAPVELEGHAKYLLGKGPKPETKPQAADNGTAGRGAAGSAHPGSGSSTGGRPVTVTDASFVKIAKVNVDENPRIAGMYGIQSIPTMMVVKNGKIVERWAGALPEPALRARLGKSI
jgi:thioredoxin 1